MDITTIYDDLIELLECVHDDIATCTIAALNRLDMQSTKIESDYLTVIENLKVDRAHYLDLPEHKTE